MRKAVTLLVALWLAAGCSGGDGPVSQPSRLSPIPSRPPPSSSATTSTPVPVTPPGPGTPIGQVTAWIAAGKPADTADFHQLIRDGTATQLGKDVAFSTPSGKTGCVTDTKRRDGALACLVKFVNPPPRPADAYGNWVGDWVDFDGPSVSVGSVHGDPGLFVYGDGPPLPYGSSLRFGDFACRADQVGLFCVNNANQSAVRLNDAGVETFGCLRPVAPPADVGRRYGC